MILCRSWQTLKFDKQPAAFIRIVGTHNTANEVRGAARVDYTLASLGSGSNLPCRKIH